MAMWVPWLVPAAIPVPTPILAGIVGAALVWKFLVWVTMRVTRSDQVEQTTSHICLGLGVVAGIGIFYYLVAEMGYCWFYFC